MWYNYSMSSQPTPEIRFRNDTNQRYTRQLFVDCQRELTLEDRLIEPPYTLMHDVKGKVNFRKIYVELADPTGYQLAIRYLEDFDHWRLLMKSPWFREAKAIWDEELDAKLKSEGMAAIRLFADGVEGVAPAVQLQAAKYLAGLEHRKKPATEKPTRGRPSKAEVQGELKRTASDNADIAADFDRIRLVKG